MWLKVLIRAEKISSISGFFIEVKEPEGPVTIL
jgi:hypothetical protein